MNGLRGTTHAGLRFCLGYVVTTSITDTDSSSVQYCGRNFPIKSGTTQLLEQIYCCRTSLI